MMLLRTDVAWAAEFPADVLAKLVLSAIAADRDLGEVSGPAIDLVIVGQTRRAEELLRAFEAYSGRTIQGKAIEVVRMPHPGAITWQKGAADVVIFSEKLGDAAGGIGAAAAAAGIRTVGASAADVDKGLTFGFEVAGSGKPRFVVNEPVAAAVGARFAGAILKYARFVGVD
jgi:hypothetical protein